MTVAEQLRRALARAGADPLHPLLVGAYELEPLAADDLELLAVSACMRGREDEWIPILECAYQRHSEAVERRPAVRCASSGGVWGVCSAWSVRSGFSTGPAWLPGY